MDYTIYINYLKTIINNISDFKSNSIYRGILEHVDNAYGIDYINAIRTQTSITDNEINEFCKLNDSVGMPLKSEIDGTINTSPTNLRYIYHTHLILQYFKSLSTSPINIVELGGGYGGLFLCIDFFKNKYNISINSYKIIDLPEANQLQKLYISNFNPTTSIEFHSSELYGLDISMDNLYLISNFCFSELPMNLQKQYINNLFNKVVHGFMAWNWIIPYNFGFKYRNEPELHTNSERSRYIYF